jgi:DNA mismatch repair protein MutS
MMPTPYVSRYWQLWGRIKAKSPDGILLLRIGDFMEAFADDAQKVHEVCDVILSKRTTSTDGRGHTFTTPMAGFPVCASEVYIAELRQAGFNVEIEEGMEETIC